MRGPTVASRRMMDPVELGRSAAFELADRLRSRIRGGELDAGERLPNQKDMATGYGVALATVREALRILSAEGYVEVRRGGAGGTFVSALEGPRARWRAEVRESLPAIDHVLDLRVAIEGHAAFLAAKRISVPQLAEMTAAVEEMAALADGGGFRSADARFHAAVAAASANPRIEQAVRDLRGEIFLSADPLGPRFDIAATLTAHNAVLAAIRAGEAVRARTAMEAHIQHTRVELQEVADGRR